MNEIKNMPTQSRNYQLDIIRIIACLMVITMHAPKSGVDLPGWFCAGIYALTSPCIGLFFMVSGALLLPVKLSYQDFIKKRLFKFVVPTLVFTVFYLVIKDIPQFAGGGITYINIIRSILSIPFSPQGTGILWFIYPLVGIYFLAPIITPFFESCSKRNFQFVLLLWFISISLSSLVNYLDVRTDETSLFYSFGGFAGYFILGYYLKRFPININFFFIPFLIVVPFAITYLSHEGYFKIDTWYLSVFCVMQCMAWYQLILQYANTDNWSMKSKRLTEIVSNCSFGIYLIHPFLLYRIFWKIDFSNISPYMANVLITIFTFIASLFISYCFSKTKYGHFIVGYRSGNYERYNCQ